MKFIHASLKCYVKDLNKTMKASDTREWEFSQTPTDADDIKCPKCNIFSPLSKWTCGEGLEWCELCGDYHIVMFCPKCMHETPYIHQEGHLEIRLFPRKIVSRYSDKLGDWIVYEDGSKMRIR